MENNTNNLQKTFSQAVDNYKKCGMLATLPLQAAYEWTKSDNKALDLILLPESIIATPIILFCGIGLAVVNTAWAAAALPYAAYQDYQTSDIPEEAPKNDADLPEDFNASHKTMQAQMPANAAKVVASNETGQKPILPILISETQSTENKLDSNPSFKKTM